MRIRSTDTGVLYTLDAEATLLSRVENLEGAVAEYQMALSEAQKESARLREQVFKVQLADGISSALAESRGEDLRRCEADLSMQRWVTRGVGVLCGAVLIFRPSLTNPVPR